jgi:hypothetical protein
MTLCRRALLTLASTFALTSSLPALAQVAKNAGIQPE